LNDVTIDAYKLVKGLLKMYFNDRDKIKFEHFEKFMTEFDSYFMDDDREKFLKEVSYIKRGNDEIDVNELASMIRDDVEYFPK